jgi:protein-disulfide isomerase
MNDTTRDSGHAAGRTLLLIVILVVFAAGAFAGYLIAHEKKPLGALLSRDVFMVGIGDSPGVGPDTALVTIVEFNDMTCGPCNRADNVLRQTVDLYPGEVRVVWKHLPADPESQDARRAAEMGVGAAMGGKFWEIRDKVAVAEGKPDFERIAAYASEIGLDGKRLLDELGRGVYTRRATIDFDTAGKLGIKTPPALFINGKKFIGEVTLDRLKAAIELQLPEAKALLGKGISPAQVYWEIVKKGKNKVETAVPPTAPPPAVPPPAATPSSPVVSPPPPPPAAKTPPPAPGTTPFI